MIQILSRSPAETRQIGEALAKKLRGGTILALLGDLGSGKTTFVKGLAQGLGIRKTIKSPTFVIMSLYRRPGKPRKFFFHFDLYRIKHKKELYELGFTEILHNRQNIVAVEWPENAGGFLPRNSVVCEFRPGRLWNERIITLWQKK